MSLALAAMAVTLGAAPDSGVVTRACAHRGDSKNAPENSVPAFVSAVMKGAHQIEFDPHLSKDGRLAVIHDNTVDRTTDGTGRVADLTFAEIRALDAGAWFGPEFEGARIPTFREALEAIPRRVLCNVHLIAHRWRSMLVLRNPQRRRAYLGDKRDTGGPG